MSDEFASYGRGLIPRDYTANPEGSLAYAAPFNMPLIPRNEWPDRIADMERNKSRLSDIADQAGVPCLNQGSVGYCHAFSPCYAVMALRAAMGLPFEELSASSIGGPVTGFRNAGAYIFDDLKHIVDHGVATTKTYPMLTTSNHWNQAAQQEAAKHKVTEWWELKNRNFDQTMTCLLSRIPVCVGLNHWAHAVTYLDPIYKDGKFGVLMQNSWGVGWGQNGRAEFMEGYGQGRATPDEQYAPRQITGA